MEHYWLEAAIFIVVWLAALACWLYDRRHARRMREAQQPRRIHATYGPGYGLLGWEESWDM